MEEHRPLTGHRPRGRRSPLGPAPAGRLGAGGGRPGRLVRGRELFVSGDLTSFLPSLPLHQGLSVAAGRRPEGYFSAGIADRCAALPTHGTRPRRKCPGIALRAGEEEDGEEDGEEGPAENLPVSRDTDGTCLPGQRSTGCPPSPGTNPPPQSSGVQGISRIPMWSASSAN